MQIDRARFLLLTASMAGASSGCGAGSAAQGSSGPAPVVAEPVVALPEPAAAGAKDGNGKTLGEQDAEPGEEDETLAALSTPPSGADGSDALMCDDAGAAPKSCKPLR